MFSKPVRCCSLPADLKHRASPAETARKRDAENVGDLVEQHRAPRTFAIPSAGKGVQNGFRPRTV